MSDAPVFSIVTPSFNQLDLLADCMASVREQATGDLPIEHIVQDAGTPGIEDFARKHGASFYRDSNHVFSAPIASVLNSGYSLKISSEKDSGMYDAINKGFTKARGAFCAWLNCDEQYAVGALRLVARTFNKFASADAVFGDMVVIEAEANPLCYRRGIVQNTRLLAFSALNISSCTLFIRRRLVDCKILLDPSWRIVGDKEWIVRLLRAGVVFQPLHKPVACFHLLPNSLTASPEAAAEDERLGRLLGIPSFAERAVLKVGQIVRKLAAGCYFPRRVDLQIPCAEGRSLRVGPSWVGFRWPTST